MSAPRVGREGATHCVHGGRAGHCNGIVRAHLLSATTNAGLVCGQLKAAENARAPKNCARTGQCDIANAKPIPWPDAALGAPTNGCP